MWFVTNSLTPQEANPSTLSQGLDRRQSQIERIAASGGLGRMDNFNQWTRLAPPTTSFANSLIELKIQSGSFSFAPGKPFGERSRVQPEADGGVCARAAITDRDGDAFDQLRSQTARPPAPSFDGRLGV